MSQSSLKDFFAIFTGAFIGALLAHSAGYLWFLGVLAGGGIGYLARLLMEPERVLFAARFAWRKAVVWRPKPDWKERFMTAWYFSLALSGPFGLVLGMTVVLPIYFIERFSLLLALTLYFLLDISLLMTGLVLVFIAEYADPYPSFSFRMRMKSAARIYNPIMIHWFVLKHMVLGLWFVPKFLKIFLRFVHSHDFTACGVYACAGALAIFLTVPFSPLAILVAALLSGAVGASLRRVVLRALAENIAH